MALFIVLFGHAFARVLNRLWVGFSVGFLLQLNCHPELLHSFAHPARHANVDLKPQHGARAQGTEAESNQSGKDAQQEEALR